MILEILFFLGLVLLYDQLRFLRKIERHLKSMANAPVPAPPPPPQPPPPQPKPVVLVEINCPTCHHPFTVPTGIKTNCPRCGENVIAE